ncbi:MAG TPA: hypothetical protein VF581_04065 [Flavobacterium sp.]|jgi:hypothetical protein
MDSKRMISILLLAAGVIMIGFGIFRMNTDTSGNTSESLGMYVLSVGAVVAIFATGAMVGDKS